MSLRDMLADIEELVTCESPSTDLAAVAASADVVARIGTRRLGVAPERIVVDGRTHLRWRFGNGQARVLLLGHHDTVWPLGSLATHPFGVTGGVLRGPGCFDMKTGVVMAFHAIAELQDRSGVTLLVTGDEEIGSPSSRALIETEAAGCRAALVLEPSADGGALKTERKGVSLYRVRARGLAAHAGLEPERGVNATVELAHQILAVTAIADPALGTTVTPTLMSAGTATNTVPAAGEFAVDVRVRSAAEQERVDTAMRSLMPASSGAQLEVTGGPNRPPLAVESSASLFDRASALAAGLGLPSLTHVAVGGASDGNFTAGMGIPTLDGLGAVGGGAHADDEHVVVAEVPGRTALVAAFVAALLDDEESVRPDQSGRDVWCAPTMTNVEEVASMTHVTDPMDDTAPQDSAARAARLAGVIVRELAELDDLNTVCRLCDEIWRPDPNNPPVTTKLLRALTKAGNYVAGAFEGDRLVGACVGFFGTPSDTTLHSHVTGVSAEAMGRSVGFALKLHQRAWAISRGLSSIAWTFDPLVSRNAYFNLAKLGATPTEYLPNFYGGMHDAINGSDESDRLLVCWNLNSRKVNAACAGSPVIQDGVFESGEAVIALDRSAAGLPVPGSLDGPRLLVATPRDIESLRTTDPSAAEQWRISVCQVLGGLLAEGACVTGYDRSGWYLVSRKDSQ